MEKNGITKNMAAFEKVFEDLDVQTADLTGAIGSATAASGDQDAVNQLLQQMQSEQAMSAGLGMG